MSTTYEKKFPALLGGCVANINIQYEQAIEYVEIFNNKAGYDTPGFNIDGTVSAILWLDDDFNYGPLETIFTFFVQNETQEEALNDIWCLDLPDNEIEILEKIITKLPEK